MGYVQDEYGKYIEYAKKFSAQASKDFASFGKKSFVYPPLQCEEPKFIHIADNVNIHGNGWIGAVENYAGVSYNPELYIGKNTMIGHFVHIIFCSKMIIGEDVLMADRVYITDNIHGYEDINVPPFAQPLKSSGPVKIGDQTWVGEGVCIMPNVTVGRHCVIGSNAVVTRNVPDYCVAAGIPAKVIKKYDALKKEWIRV